MVIRFDNNKEWRVTLVQLEKQGYLWLSGRKPTLLFFDKNNGYLMLDVENKKILGFCTAKDDAARASQLYKNLLR